MGVYDRKILDYVDGKDNNSCQVTEVLDNLKNTPDFMSEQVIKDINNLINDGLLAYDKDNGTLSLLPKAKRPVVPIPPDPRRKL